LSVVIPTYESWGKPKPSKQVFLDTFLLSSPSPDYLPVLPLLSAQTYDTQTLF
ncbi:hypothetical protein ILUMI_16569, partial [Ignelater luminosus]